MAAPQPQRALEAAPSQATDVASSAAKSDSRSAKPTVFFSASRKDYQWREKIKAALRENAKVVDLPLEIWDDSEIQTGHAWRDDIEAAINRASVAVILLSPDYLASRTAQEELDRLFQQKPANRLALFPVVLRDCDWRSQPKLKEIQIWNYAEPLDSPERVQVDRALQEIAERIATLIINLASDAVPAQKTPGESEAASGLGSSEEGQVEGRARTGPSQETGESSDVPAANFHFSADTQKVIARAQGLMKESNRLRVTSGCLLFAIAQDPHIDDKTAGFLREAITVSKGFEAALRDFRADGERAPREGSRDAGPLLGKISSNAWKILTEATNIAAQVSPSSPQRGLIQPRHILAALLNSASADPNRSVGARLRKIGIDGLQLRRDFLAFVQLHFESEDNLKAWIAIFTPPLRSDIKFSAPTEIALEEAKSLMGQSRRLRLSVSCLLFGLASERATRTRSPTAEFLRRAFGSDQGYIIGLQEFLRDGDKNPRDDTVQADPPFGPIDRTVAGVLKRIQDIMAQVSPRQKEIENRHLLAALLVNERGETPSSVAARLGKMRIASKDFREKFYKFLRGRSEIETQDKPIEWHRILAPWVEFDNKTDGTGPSREDGNTLFTPGTAGYNPDFCALGGPRVVVDHLNMEADANRLAELIALRETKLPLAIGLFGNWGSGKSHFMNLIDQHVRKLADEQKNAPPQGQDKWCREIVPIYFNAWHYLDANLWASLVSQIFESLFARLRPKEDDFKKLQELLEKASGTAARAAEEVSLAQCVTEKAQAELTAARTASIEKQTVKDGLLKGLSNLLPQVSREELRKQTIELLGVEKEVKTIDDLRKVVEESHSLSRRVWNSAWKQPGRGWRMGYLVASVAIAPALICFVAPSIPYLKDVFVHIGKILSASLTGLCAFLAWLTPSLRKAKDGLKKVEAWQEQAEAEQMKQLETPPVQKARQELSEAQAHEQGAKIRLAAAQARENQLKREADNLTPERRLGRFIEARAQSGDYRGQLGLVSLARRDFQELSDLFADADALKQKVRP